MSRLKNVFDNLKARWKQARQPGGFLRPLDADDRQALAFLINQAGEVLRDGSISAEEEELLKEAWERWREARKNTP